MMMRELPLGFADPVAHAQSAFRAALRALSSPGECVECAVPTPEVNGLMPATVALLLALTDFETPVWWAGAEAAGWLQFHTGAPVAARPADAHFAVIRDALAVPRFPELNTGTDESPQCSATLLIELPSWGGGAATVWSGPGLQQPRTLRLAGLPEHFWAHWRDNHAGFPRGVDVFFIHGRHVVGLPRTTYVQATEAV